MNEKKQFGGKKKKILIAVAVLLVCILLVVLAVSIVSEQGRKKLTSSMTATTQDVEYGTQGESAQIVTYNGKKYKYNENLSNILCMGIDVRGKLVEHEEWGNSGQADSNMLVSYDTETGRVKVLTISRDTMTEIEHFAYDHTSNGWAVNHLTLGYAMGDGRDVSCQLMTNAVSRLLYGVPIQKYFALSVERVADVNDIFGGVTVTIPNDDLDIAPYYYKKGQQVLLKGDAAYRFLQRRDITVDGSNNGRMERQKTYMKAFYNTAKEQILANPTKAIEVLNSLDGYYVTNFSASEVLYLAQNIGSIQFSPETDVYTEPGSNDYSEKYDEFYVDEDALREMILEIFYKEIEE